MGPNGAGKTTLLNVIGGSLRADRGRVVFDGHEITRLPAHRHCRVGIGRTFQMPRPFGGLTAYENVLVAFTYGRAKAGEDAKSVCAPVLERVGLRAKADTPAASLTLLERKRLELARALVTRPRVLLLDEVAGGLTEPEVNALVETDEGRPRRGRRDPLDRAHRPRAPLGGRPHACARRGAER